jgi:hypothetical protein
MPLTRRALIVSAAAGLVAPLASAAPIHPQTPLPADLVIS